MSEEDFDPKLTHKIDQFSASLNIFAHLFARYYFALKARGLPSEDAVYLTGELQTQYMHALLGAAFDKQKEEGS